MPFRRRRQALFIFPSLIGDTILVTGLIRHFRDEDPDLAITVATSPLPASLFTELRGVERVIPFRKSPFKTHWLRLWPQVLGRWDLVVDMRGSLMSLMLPGRRIAHRPPRPKDSEHRVVTAARLVGRATDPPAPLIECAAETDARAATLLGPGPVLALAPSATWQGKMWPAERFVALAAALLDHHPALQRGRVAVIGGPGDTLLNASLAARLGPSRLLDLLGLDLLTTFACLKRVRLFVGNDSGMMHLSAVAGAPTLGLFGPSPDVVFAPWGPAATFVRGPRSHADFGMHGRRFAWNENHMGDLSLEQVQAAAEALLARTAPAWSEPVSPTGQP